MTYLSFLWFFSYFKAQGWLLSKFTICSNPTSALSIPICVMENMLYSNQTQKLQQLTRDFLSFSATVRQMKQSLRFDIKLQVIEELLKFVSCRQRAHVFEPKVHTGLFTRAAPPPRRSCLMPGESQKKCWRGCVRAGHMCWCALKCSAYSVIWTQPLTTPLSVEREPAHSRCAVSPVHTQSSAASVLDAATDGSHARNEFPKQQRLSVWYVGPEKRRASRFSGGLWKVFWMSMECVIV